MDQLTYVVVTPARNEEGSIELTIQSMVNQTVRPALWVIVSDGSTDRTDEIVEKYVAQYPWIQLVRMPERRERHFAGKVYAFRAGFEQLKGISYDVIASLDGDISFDDEYFAFLLQKLVDDPKLGLVGTPFREKESSEIYDYRFVSIEHVSGACQVFRRACFEQIGGYRPIKSGGIDHIMVVTARMLGWKTRTFTEKTCLHHRPMGTAQNSLVIARFKSGTKDYAFGNHPVWQVFRSLYQMSKRPRIVGGLSLLAGYFWSAMRRHQRPVSSELVAFTRREQMERLKRFLKGRRPTASVHGMSPESAKSVTQ